MARPQDLEGYDDWLQKLVESLPPEQRLAGLTPEQVLTRFAPEQRLAGLAPEQRLADVPETEQLLALSPHLLQQLPEDYIASLPADVQARVRARRGR